MVLGKLVAVEIPEVSEGLFKLVLKLCSSVGEIFDEGLSRGFTGEGKGDCLTPNDVLDPLRHLYMFCQMVSPVVQWVKKLSQCLAVLERLTCRKPNKLCNNLQIIYIILGYLGFQTNPISCDLDYN
jgi:hypothetical protein